MNREAISLGISFGKLDDFINKSFTSKLGPGEFPIKTRKKIVSGIIAPVFDYDVVNHGMAWPYKELAEAEVPEVYVIIGRGKEGFKTYLFGDWNTPLGVVKINKKFGMDLIKRFNKLRNDMQPFIEDTSVERQLPFLQYINKDFLDKISFVPILVGDVSYGEIIEFADALSDVNVNVCFIFSCNLTYYGKEFGYLPFLHDVKNNLHMIDRRLIEFICNLDSKGFYEAGKRGVLDRNVLTLCIELMRGLGFKKGRFLNYYTSGDLKGYEKSVGFGSVVF